MKKSSATIYSPTLELPVITRKFSRRANRIKISSSTPADIVIVLSAVPPPTEETIERLNQLGQQYPFCVYYKQKDYDPL